MARILYSYEIPNLPSPNQNVQRRINIYGVNADGLEECATIPYEIQYTKNGLNVSDGFEKRFKPMQWKNSDFVYERNLETFEKIPNPDYQEAFEGNQLPQTIPNPNYVDEETTPNMVQFIPNPEYVSNFDLSLVSEYNVKPAFDYFADLFTARIDLFWLFLGYYIEENYGDGWYGSQSKPAILKN